MKLQLASALRVLSAPMINRRSMPKMANKELVLEGGCLCGFIRFEARGAPGKPHTCSCGMCRKHTGSYTANGVEYPSDAVTWTGEGGAPATWRSSDYSSRAFCPRCGSSLGAIDDAPTIGLLTGVFDKPNLMAFKPTGHSYKGCRPKWWQVEIEG
jgi:hypothetical protein